MKKLLMILLLSSSFCMPIICNAPQQTKPVEDDDQDGIVVLANVANMLANLGAISTDPHNPKVLGPGIAQIGLSFINIIAQVFKDMPIDRAIIQEHIVQYFDNLPDQIKRQLIVLIIEYAQLTNQKSDTIL